MLEFKDHDSTSSEQISIPEDLNPLSLSLKGQALIEASAGTGKTYTLAALYLRLVLGLGRKEPLETEQILVVTFTQAATQELRERIRTRIQEARIAFITGRTNDPFLEELMKWHKDHERAILDLEFAASEMDQAAIFTIHGFCQRMLEQHAFESGTNFNAELINDDSHIVRTALLDYWRCELYNVDQSLAQEILSFYPTPDKLLSQIRSYLSFDNLNIHPDYSEYPLQEKWGFFVESQELLRKELRSVFDSDAEEDDLLDIVQRSTVDKRSYSKKNLPNWLDKIAAFAHGAKAPFKELEKFSQGLLREKSKSEPPEHIIFEKIEAFCDQRINIKAVIFSKALYSIKQNMTREKDKYHQLSFDDLLNKLATALESDSAEMLIMAIRKQYPFALIDEFQDTDPKQYSIFNRLYGEHQLPLTHDDAQDLGFLMIGDPKQSIYAFRGADIFTYMQAREEVRKHYTLGKNWRSSESMVSATNTLFMRSPAPFIYQQNIPFHPVEAALKKQTGLFVDGNPVSSMSLWFSEKTVNNDQYLSHSAITCAAQIDKMLRLGRLSDHAITPANIAVLVRDRKEANLIQQALMQVNIDSVFMSNRENVYQTILARELQYLLQAVNEPNNERLLRTALATTVFQFNAKELFEINQDEVVWEALVDEFSHYRKIWLNSGVLPMLHAVLQNRELAKRWLSYHEGERRLTDYLHLSELLQQASVELESNETLIRFLQDRRTQPSHQSQEQQLRMDSDRQRITVITIHKSKGLEYDLVYLPFACRYRASTGLLYHDDKGQPMIDLEGNDGKDAADKEQLAEDLRLLYVAITRAAYACFIGMADVHLRKKSVWKKTAIGYLLTLIKEGEKTKWLENQTLKECLILLQTCNDNISLIATDDIALEQVDMFSSDSQMLGNEESKPTTLAARTFERDLNRDWRVTSYSALSKNAEHRLLATKQLVNDKLDLEVLQEESEAITDHSELTSDNEYNIFTFYKGAVAGTFLHNIYEEIDFSSTDKSQIEEVLEKRLPLVGYDLSWLPCLTDFVDQSLEVYLTPEVKEESFNLRAITPQNRLVEMEFVMPFKKIQNQAVNTLLIEYDALSARAGRLQFDSVEGMLRGFIDLTLRHNGKYYIIDYKSNHLGSSILDYHRENLEIAMIEHRYDFQYILYTLAIHRFLKSRLKNYDYDQHVGGVFYLFLRGLEKGKDSGVFYTKPAKALIEKLDNMFETS